MTNEEQQIDILGRLILDGNLCKEDRDYCIYWRDYLKQVKESTDKNILQTKIANESHEKGRDNTCCFEISWAGKCKKPIVNPEGFCSTHKDAKCAGCGKQGIQDCSTVLGQFLCGRISCGKCRCTH